ncbi:MAG TPA: galactose-1-phosphate uridylyltransferase, partial [Bdellovibrionales bacterium]|nr:galactose-1-phosphate uridylyltransferase [Bdellovibrionales bacterium]
HLYSRRPIPEGLVAPSPNSEPVRPNPHLRFNPMRGEWVGYASHRQNRTFLPPPEYNPLAPMRDPRVPTELPPGEYDVAVFENLFPALSEQAHSAPELYVPTMKGEGVCEVVVFTQDPKASLASLPLEHVALILDVWAQRYDELGRRPHIKYVMPFENRGVEVGVTLHHPHGQIYSYPFVPPVVANKLRQQKDFQARHGRGLLADMIAREIKDDLRTLYVSPEAAAFVPVCARYPYEVWVAPRRQAGSLSELSPAERLELARALKTVLMKYDGLWKRPFPYLMVLHQAPTDGSGPEFHMHFEFYPPYRTADKLKYLAGTELGAGLFANDSLPEEKARELRDVHVELSDLKGGANG